MARSTWHFKGSVLVYLCLCCLLCAKNVNTEEKEEDKRSWFERKPHFSMDFNVLIDAGTEECYFHYVQEGAAFYVSYQVLSFSGGDGMAGFAVKHPNGSIAHPYEVKQWSSYGDNNSTGGYYSFCVYNQYSTYAAKTVAMYISSMKVGGWQQYEKELHELHLNIKNFTSIIDTVERKVDIMHQFQSHRRGLEARDVALLQANNSYVQNWSIAQIVVIILTCTFQVFFVRRLFDIKTGNIKVQI